MNRRSASKSADTFHGAALISPRLSPYQQPSLVPVLVFCYGFCMGNGIDKGGRSRSHRSSVSNGTRLFAISEIDGRTSTARRFRDIIETVTSDLGGKDLLSEAQRQLIRRASALSIMCESVEIDLVRDLPFDVANYLSVRPGSS